MVNYDDVYNRLVERYNAVHFGGRRRLDKEIEKLMESGCSWEEALEKIYLKEFGKTVQEETREKEVVEKSLEKSLIDLRTSDNYGPLIFLFVLFLFPLFMVAPMLVFLVFIFAILLLAIANYQEIEWSFSENIVLKDCAQYLDKIIEIVPQIFQEIILKDISVKREGNILNISMHVSGSILERSSERGSIVYADIGIFTIKSIFDKMNDDINVSVEYYSSTPRKYSSLASEIYEKIVIGYRSALNEAVNRIRRSRVEFTFSNLLEMLGRKGIILNEIRCPRCGAPVKLPEKGDTVECEYCGTVIKAIDILKIIRDISSS